MAIAPGGLLSINYFSVAPLAEATNFEFRLRENAHAIDSAVEDAGQQQGDRQRRDSVPKVGRPASLIAFNAEGRVVETLLSTGTVLDVFF